MSVDTRYHPADRCWFCGSRFRLIEVVIKATRARGMRCADAVGCVRRARRRREREQGRAA